MIRHAKGSHLNTLETGAVITICKYSDVHIGYGEFT